MGHVMQRGMNTREGSAKYTLANAVPERLRESANAGKRNSNVARYARTVGSNPTMPRMDKRARYIENQRIRGLCRYCPRPREPERTMCKIHLQKTNDRIKGIIKRAIETGLCRFCRRPVEKGYKTCNRNECIPSRRLTI